MKDMTVEELIKYICDDCIAVDSPEFPNELLRRFEELKKANSDLAAAAIEQPPYKEDLMCCGNCVHLQTRQCSRYDLYARSGEWPPACEYCNKWHDDGLTREEREGK